MKLADELNKRNISPEAVSWDNGEAKLVNARNEDVSQDELDELGITQVSVDMEDGRENFWVVGGEGELGYRDEAQWDGDRDWV